MGFGCTVKNPGGVHSHVLWRGRNEHHLKGSDTGLLWNKGNQVQNQREAMHPPAQQAAGPSVVKKGSGPLRKRA